MQLKLARDVVVYIRHIGQRLKQERPSISEIVCHFRKFVNAPAVEGVNIMCCREDQTKTGEIVIVWELFCNRGLAIVVLQEGEYYALLEDLRQSGRIQYSADDLNEHTQWDVGTFGDLPALA